MKLNNALALPLVFCVTALALVVGCSRFNPVSIPNPIPAPQTVLSSGVAGTWLGNVLTPSSYGGCSANPAIVPVTDTLSDDSSTLQLTTISTCGLYIFSSAVTVNPSSYYPKGHLQFDILLGNPPANYSSISIQYLYSNERASARETAARVVAGRLAKSLLATIGVHVVSHVVRIGARRDARRASSVAERPCHRRRQRSSLL